MQSIITPQWRGRLTLLLIIGVFLAPLIGASWLYYNTDTGQPWATANHGQLITPPTVLKDFQLTYPDGQLLALNDIKKKWTLIFVAPMDCGEVCQRNIYHMRQVSAALGREQHRVQRLLVATNTTQLESLHDFLQNYQDMKVVFPAAANESLLSELTTAYAAINQGIFLIDPLGNLMMVFPEDLDPRDMLKDIKKLLKTSSIG